MTTSADVRFLGKQIVVERATGGRRSVFDWTERVPGAPVVFHDWIDAAA